MDRQTLDERTNQLLEQARRNKRRWSPKWLRRSYGPRVRTSVVALFYLFVGGMLFSLILEGRTAALVPFFFVVVLFLLVYLE